MKGFLLLVFLLLVILLLGAGMLKAARWSRKKNTELKEKQEDSQELAIRKILKGEVLKESVANYYASSLPESVSLIGKTLAIAVILFFVILALFATYFLWEHNGI